MSIASLHDDLIVFDGLIVSNWSREIFENMHEGGLTGANCTCCVWEDFAGTMQNIAEWKKRFNSDADLIIQANTTADIRAAKAAGKTAIALGFQNVSAFEDQIGYIRLFKELGVGIVQMAYNTQNLIGSGCYESHDGGLSDFGREAVAEMNRVGIMCDLSHVGAKTSQDVIDASDKPVCYSHIAPAGLKDHPRNKTDAQIRTIVEKGGFVGVTMFPPFLKRGIDSTVDDYVEAMNYIINIAGEDAVGYGTDFTQGYDRPFFEWITMDKGYARKLTEFGEILSLEGIGRIGETSNLTAAMERAGWREPRIRKVMGENWLRALKDVWGE
ncbi:MAG TPA: peptidase M19 [Rhodospirillaceae bacterium]|nr:peptidase M19 [Rhodospirillaceae bacterium]